MNVAAVYDRRWNQTEFTGLRILDDLSLARRMIMSNRLLPLNATDFGWLRYGLGVAAPLGLIAYGIYSLATRQSCTYEYRVGFVHVQGEQALLMGIAYIGIALMLFANCYAQYHDKMGFHYQWILASGAVLAGGGVLGCSWIFLLG